MSQPRKTPGVSRLGPNLWKVRVTKTDEKTGRRLDDRRVVRGDLRAALEEQARLRVALEEARPARIRLKDYAAAWFKANEPRWRLSTRLRTAEHVDEIARGRLGDAFVDSIRPGDAEAFLADLVAGHRDGDGLGAHAVRAVLAILRRICGAARRDLGIVGFSTGVTCPIRPRGYDEDRPNCLTREQLGALWLSAAGSVWLGPIALTGVLGMRTCEVFALQWRDVEEGRIVLRRSVYRGEFGEPKTSSSRRWLPCPAEVLALLPARRGPDDLVFPNADGEVYKAPGKAFGVALSKLCAAAGVPRVTPHGLRRTANTALVDARVPAEVVRSILGHTDAAMTGRYYHAAPAAKHHAVTQALAGLGAALPVALGGGTPAN